MHSRADTWVALDSDFSLLAIQRFLLSIFSHIYGVYGWAPGVMAGSGLGQV